MNALKHINRDKIKSAILLIRGQRVILDSDLARFYGVTTKRLNEQVKRNRKRFPPDFIFKLTQCEIDDVEISRSQNATLKRGQNIKYRSYAFTEYGAFMAANVLKTHRAIRMSLFVIRIFVKMRENVSSDRVLEKRLAMIEKTLLDHDVSLRELMLRIRQLLLPPR